VTSHSLTDLAHFGRSLVTVLNLKTVDIVLYAPEVTGGHTLRSVYIDSNILQLILQAPKHFQRTHANAAHRHIKHYFHQSPADLAKLRSIACRTSGAFLDTIPKSNRLSLSDDACIDSCQFRLDASGFVHHAPAVKCYCGAAILGNEATHAMCCKHISRSRQHHQHDMVTEALRNATRAGIPSTREPYTPSWTPLKATTQVKPEVIFLQL
jgi:hypothetical protein